MLETLKSFVVSRTTGFIRTQVCKFNCFGVCFSYLSSCKLGGSVTMVKQSRGCNGAHHRRIKEKAKIGTWQDRPILLSRCDETVRGRRQVLIYAAGEGIEVESRSASADRQLKVGWMDLASIKSWLDRRRWGRRGKVDPAERYYSLRRLLSSYPHSVELWASMYSYMWLWGPTSELHLFFSCAWESINAGWEIFFYSLRIEACTWPLSLGYHSDSVLKEERVSASTFHGRII
jgi:hypothetical protein